MSTIFTDAWEGVNLYRENLCSYVCSYKRVIVKTPPCLVMLPVT